MTAQPTDPAGVVIPRAASAGSDGGSGEYAGEEESLSPLPSRILVRLVRPRLDCILWTGATDRGYGRVSVDGVVKRVHRVVWESERGPIPPGLTIDHLCRVKTCCNTDHMELVTQGENARRAVQTFPRVRRTHCAEGHELTADNVYSSPSDPTYRHCRKCLRRRKREAARRRRAAG